MLVFEVLIFGDADYLGHVKFGDEVTPSGEVSVVIVMVHRAHLCLLPDVARSDEQLIQCRVVCALLVDLAFELVIIVL